MPEDRARSMWRGRCAVAPSLLGFDLCNLQREVEMIAACGIEILHIDVIDGHFSPSMPLGIETIGQLRRRSDLAFDVHVMAARHDYFVDALLDMGLQQLSFHAETEPHPSRLLGRIRAAGARAGVALKPSTPVAALDCLIEQCDNVLLMLTNPGFSGHGGEAQVPYAARKIEELRALIDRRGLDVSIEIDGRVSPETMRRFAPATVDVFVAGSACIAKGAPEGSLRDLVALSRQLAGDEPGTPDP